MNKKIQYKITKIKACSKCYRNNIKITLTCEITLIPLSLSFNVYELLLQLNY